MENLVSKVSDLILEKFSESWIEIRKMLLRGRYDFTPRAEDSNQTLGFKKGDVVLFLQVYPKDSNWFHVADSNGRIGYIPKNYVKLNDNLSYELILQFLLEAIYKSRKDKLPTQEKLESLKVQVTRKEYREFQSRIIRLALQRQEEDIGETETTYTCNSEYLIQDEDEEYSAQTPHSERKSSKTVPGGHNNFSDGGSGVERNADEFSSKTYGVQRPVSGRASKSCPQTTTKTPAARNLYAGGGDNSAKKGISKTRIPVRTLAPIVQQFRASTNTRALTPRDDDDEEWQKMADRLTRIVQESGNLDPKRSEIVVHRVLHHVQQHFHPDIPGKLQSVLRVLETSPKSFPSSVEESDSTRIVREIFLYLSSLDKHNFHTRGHATEESKILRKLNQLSEELLIMDADQLRNALQSDNYQSLHESVLIYGSENLVEIKSKFLDIFSMIATLSESGRSILLRSILPITLAKEMYENEGSPGKLSRLANTLVSLMSSGEAMPQTHFEELGPKFTNFVLNYLEDSAQQTEEVEQTKSDFFHLLLSYNLQFTPKDENLLTKTLAGRQPGRYFMESLMNLFESEEDPIKGGSTHSLFKLMNDMFSSKITAEHFHKADMKWLTDLIYRNVSELGPGDKRRTDYLDLLWLVMRNRTFQYRIKDIKEILFAILLEEDGLSIPDQRIVKGISKEFSSMFKKANSGSLGMMSGGGFSQNLNSAAFN